VLSSAEVLLPKHATMVAPSVRLNLFGEGVVFARRDYAGGLTRVGVIIIDGAVLWLFWIMLWALMPLVWQYYPSYEIFLLSWMLLVYL